MGLYFFCGILDHAAIQDVTTFPSLINNKCTATISERYHQRNMLPESLRKQLYLPCFCTIRKTIFAIQGHFAVHCFATQGL